ncbi:uncharacterized protein NEPG_02067 [Nematocida parisii ERTm1]|uniref:GOLD domain-containing protein n=1 Tax=Nematocida parisii (strain ERTm3) TaxID=935791 RepID=I3EF98_NEMP3|nr:uncharacterized protein NEPG_02067 [Nematocida parisii ERTm1]EIJ87895.1 hypothetical protein NEQG_01967 [Nematocida parisii ERTm3]EIJ93111.1 hypothetical protein NEPG_02067 [Nematocida parisii ERTm1]|eukprot:XP_013059894.1 hypothetical protein NEPG_02067 [Nematocida parisii ERTm1]
MNIFWLLLCITVCVCETFDISSESTFTLGLQLIENKSTRIELSLNNNSNTNIQLKDPSNKVIRSFNNDSDMNISFIPKVSGEYTITVNNHKLNKLLFTVVLPQADEGPFASQVEVNLGKDLEDSLRRIIDSHKLLLTRQKEHLDKARSTKSWIKKLTLLEVGLCLLALYYVQSEAVKTFYSTRKV